MCSVPSHKSLEAGHHRISYYCGEFLVRRHDPQVPQPQGDLNTWPREMRSLPKAHAALGYGKHAYRAESIGFSMKLIEIHQALC